MTWGSSSTASTCRMLHSSGDVNALPTMSSCDSRISAALEKRTIKISMLFAIWTPLRRKTLQNAVVAKPMTDMRIVCIYRVLGTGPTNF